MARARCPRSSVEAGQNCVEIKGENRATFFSPSENRCLPASNLKPEAREFVVDSGVLTTIRQTNLSHDGQSLMTSVLQDATLSQRVYVGRVIKC